MTARTGSAFSGYRFRDDVIALAVRWYLRYRLSYAEVAEWLAERGVAVDPSTIYDWVQAFTPRFLEAARAHRTRAGTRWRVDETLLKIGRRWRYVYLSDHRDAASARAFFERAITETGVTPTRVTSDKAKCYRPALRAVLPGAEHRPPSTWITGSSGTTSSSRGGCGPCGASRRRRRRARSAGATP